MKNKITLLVVFLVSTSLSFAQSKLDAWKELKDFHGVMSQTFHPSEEGNLEPIKARATEMKEKAFALADSKVPAEFDNDVVKDAVRRLKEGTVKMEAMVADKKSTDKEINEHLIVLHNTFHEIVEKCMKGHEESGEKK